MQTEIERLRIKRNLSRVQLAAAAGVSERTIYELETAAKRGATQRPTFLATREMIAGALGVKKAARLFDAEGRARS